MLSSLNHGQNAGPIPPAAATSERAPASAVLAYAGSRDRMTARGASGADAFGYLFDVAGISRIANPFDALGAVGAGMTAGAGLPGPSGLAAILTYFGQFVDHDITANTDRDPASLPRFAIGTPQLTLNARSDVRAQLGNLRRGTLRLDSVYGDGMAIDAKLRDGAQMRIGQTDGGAPNDLPRFGAMVDAGVVRADELPDTSAMHSDFGPVDPRRMAFIADGRNDENLVVAQLHLAFLRFHNAIADRLAGSDDERFARARQLVQWHYQWLVVERYLRAICDPAMLDAVLAGGAQRYRDFAAGHGGASGDHAPMPIEFSVAAFRFGHSMIRPGYVFNADFPRASLNQLFQFTGRGGLGGPEVLPDIWVIDWNNFIDDQPANLQALPIDAALAPALGDLVNEDLPHLRSLAQRNLRRSYVLNVPTAQAIAAQLAAQGVDIAPLAHAELVSVPGGVALEQHGLAETTPLWFYILAEAEKRGGGKRLGPLGSLIVAETLIGLLVVDPESYWHAGAGGARWHPADAGLDAPIDSFQAMLAFAGVL